MFKLFLLTNSLLWSHHLCCTGRMGYLRCVAKWKVFNMKKQQRNFHLVVILTCLAAKHQSLCWAVVFCHCLRAQLARTELAELSEMLRSWISAVELSNYQYLLFRKTYFHLNSWEANLQTLSLNEWKWRALLSTISNPHTKFRLQLLWVWKARITLIGTIFGPCLENRFETNKGISSSFLCMSSRRLKINGIQKYIIYGDRKRAQWWEEGHGCCMWWNGRGVRSL